MELLVLVVQEVQEGSLKGSWNKFCVSKSAGSVTERPFGYLTSVPSLLSIPKPTDDDSKKCALFQYNAAIPDKKKQSALTFSQEAKTQSPVGHHVICSIHHRH